MGLTARHFFWGAVCSRNYAQVIRSFHLQLAIAALALVFPVESQTSEPIFPVSCVLNVLLVLDRSDSVKGGFNKSRNFVLDVSEELTISPNQHRV